MEYNYVDFPGLQRFWENVKNYYSTSSVPGTIASADKWSTPRKLLISDNSPYTESLKDRTLGSVIFDGSSDAELKLTVLDDSHDHTLAHITDLKKVIEFTYSSQDQEEISGVAFPVETTFLKDIHVPTLSQDTDDDRAASTSYVQANVRKIIEEGVTNSLRFRGFCEYSAGSQVDFEAFLNSYEKGAYREYKIGDLYKIIVDNPDSIINPYFEILGQRVETGTVIFCSAKSESFKESDWTIIQGNKAGAVLGPDSAEDEHVALFDGITGKIIKDSGYTIGQSIPSSQDIGNYLIGTDASSDTVNITEASSINGRVITPVKKGTHGLMTSTEKTKLDYIEDQAEVNDITEIQINDLALAITGSGSHSRRFVNIDLSNYTDKEVSDDSIEPVATKAIKKYVDDINATYNPISEDWLTANLTM
jgi:hypothetical protein